MPIHDWTLVDAGLFHAFHHGWIEELARALNRGVLPADYFALPEQNIRGPIADVLTLELAAGGEEPSGKDAGVAVAAGPEYVAYVEFVGVGDELPDMPLFLKPEVYVPTPLEPTYEAAWDAFPNPVKGLLES
jgi:hypothetical protein